MEKLKSNFPKKLCFLILSYLTSLSLCQNDEIISGVRMPLQDYNNYVSTSYLIKD